MSDRNPYLLCDFHMHTTWSDGALTLRDLVDLYGRTGDFDVIAITDHILREKDWLGRAARLATLGRRRFSVTDETFPAYLEAIHEEAERAWREYELLVIPGAEVTKNHARARKNAHIVALGIERFISADQSPEDVLREIRRQGAISVACHPRPRPRRRFELETTYLWEHRHGVVDLVDVWEAANRDDLFAVTSLKHYPYIASSDFHKPKHLHSWKTLIRAEKNWEAIKDALRSNVDIAITLYRNGAWNRKDRKAAKGAPVAVPAPVAKGRTRRHEIPVRDIAKRASRSAR